VSGPETSVTDRTGEMGDNLVPIGVVAGLQGSLLLMSPLARGRYLNPGS
jgi:hypothetical protein